MTALSLEAIVKPGQPLQLTLPPDFPQGPVRITIETLPPVKVPDFNPNRVGQASAGNSPTGHRERNTPEDNR